MSRVAGGPLTGRREPDRLVMVGLSHHSAPIGVRERYELSGDRLHGWIARVLEAELVSECVVLSTCNRTECYATGPDPEGVVATLRGELDRAAGVDDGREHVVARRGLEAVQHLFRVTSGLDSLVIGEPQIQGQVSAAYHRSHEHSIGPALHRLFQSALAAGGRVRANTSISRGAASIPSAAVDLARKVFGSLEDRSVLVIGTGEMGQLTVRCLRSAGVGRVMIASRHLGRAERVGRELDGIPLTREGLWDRLDDVDLVIAATDAEAAFVTADRLAEVHDAARPTVILDIALPRNVEETVSTLPGVFLYNIDDLQRVVDQTLEARGIENEGAEAIIDYHAGKFWLWYRSREATPAIRALRGAVQRLLSEGLDADAGLGPRDVDRVEELRLASGSLLNKILHGPTQALRRLAEEPGGEDEFQRLVDRLAAPTEAWESSRIADEGLG
ncbi:MAG: glutamyl-tRNA reductase [Gemmatimonadota bacterium]